MLELKRVDESMSISRHKSYEYKQYKMKKAEVVSWLSLNNCLILQRESSWITFVKEGIAYIIYIKESDRAPSNKLLKEIKRYKMYGIKAKIVNSVFDVENLINN